MPQSRNQRLFQFRTVRQRPQAQRVAAAAAVATRRGLQVAEQGNQQSLAVRCGGVKQQRRFGEVFRMAERGQGVGAGRGRVAHGVAQHCQQ
ncbi:hypothetical protein [Methylomonas koyamae]|uniref:hypothetical protein n=1 Tax=Methylomonas koyamae TaxID=702114 RepID=UPI0018D397DC|nr:hypothetical protein [Methylomonas koyamae]